MPPIEVTYGCAICATGPGFSLGNLSRRSATSYGDVDRCSIPVQIFSCKELAGWIQQSHSLLRSLKQVLHFGEIILVPAFALEYIFSSRVSHNTIAAARCTW